MGAGYAHPLYLPGSSPVHRLQPQVKVLAAFLFVCCVVATPREVFWAFGGYLLVLTGVWVVAAIPLGWIARRALIETPFLVLAVLLPFAEGGQRVHVAGVSLSVTGLLAGWNIVVKGTLGVLTSLTLAATTLPRDLLIGLQRLRTPNTITTIATLMLRYLEVIVGEARRMRIARISRGHDPRLLWQVGATARGVGALFLRSYERGERVHLAMLARGWDGKMPVLHERPAGRREWLLGLAPVAVAVLLTAGAWWDG
ncbi:MAG: cobalt ECF transporter T component CbiQ [Actinomycetota bacterium]|nr:cobalt ECF transporter T component CbiQ [Actinomycetota bacterium]